MRQVVLISGHICTGKSELAKRLGAQFGYHVVKTSDVLKGIAKARSKPIDRVSLQKLGDILDSETDHQWLLDELLKGMQRLSTRKPIVVDNVDATDVGATVQAQSCRDAYECISAVCSRCIDAHVRIILK